MTTPRLRLLVAVALCGCGAAAAPPPHDTGQPADSSAIALADTMMVTSPVSLPAQLYVERDAVVLARQPGIVESLGADLGDYVKTGQLLVQLESTDQEIAVARAREAVDAANRLAVRTRQLIRLNGATVADSEAAESALTEAQLNLRQAERELSLTRVVAPFAGVVSARRARVGRLAAEGDSLFRITALNPLLVSVQVPESAAAGLKVGSDAQVTGVDGASAHARVVRMAPIVDAASGTLPVVLRVDPEKGLRPGGSVMVQLGQQQRRVIAIPRTAIGEDGIALVEQGGRPTARAVTLGADLGDGLVEVISGIAAGESVVRAHR
jgi:RND family efflux transporter MFP subunit